MLKKAWCSECGHYVLVTSEGICPVGHPRPALRGVEDVPDDYVLPDPPARTTAPAREPILPVETPDDYLGGFPGAGDMRLADEILEAPLVLDEPRLRRLVGIPLMVVLMTVVLTVGDIVWLNFRNSPSYCLAQVSIGVQERDWERVDKYVDIDAVVASTIDSAAASLTQNDPPSYVALIANAAEVASPYVSERAKESFRKSIERGSSSTTESVGSLRDMLAVMSVKRVTYDREGAHVTVGVRRASGAPADLGIRMQRDFFTRRWRITAIENLLDLGTRSARSNLIPIRTTTRLGNWDVRVVQVKRLASDALYRRDNAANISRAEYRRESEGSGYLAITLHVTYRGKESSRHFMRDLTPQLVSVRGTTSNSFPARLPNSIESMDAPRKGAALQGDVYFFERTQDMNGVCMAVRYHDVDDSVSAEYFALE